LPFLIFCVNISRLEKVIEKIKAERLLKIFRKNATMAQLVEQLIRNYILNH